MAVGLFTILTFGVCYIIATVINSKIDALISEYERRAKVAVNPELYKWIAFQLIFVAIGSIAVGMFLALFI